MGMEIQVSRVRSVPANAAGGFDELEAVRVRLYEQEQAPAQALSGAVVTSGRGDESLALLSGRTG